MKTLLLLLTVLFASEMRAQTTVFLADFSSSSSYFVTNTGSGGDWVVTGSGPQGSLSQFMGPLGSSTLTSFALYDSQYFGTANQDARIQMTNSVDLTGYPYAYICFQSYYKAGGGACNLEVSNDGGATWVNFGVHTNLAQGDSTLNPEVVLIDVSPVAGNQAAVNFRFGYVGGAGFAWMVDDVCVSGSNSPVSGLTNLEKEQPFRVFPNPTNETYTIDLGTYSGKSTILVTDVEGREVDRFESELTSVFVRELIGETGLYFIVVEKEDGSRMTQSIIKK